MHLRRVAAAAIALSLLLGGQVPSGAGQGSMDVTLDVHALPEQVTAGEDVTYAITITNHGPDAGEVVLDWVLEGDAEPGPAPSGDGDPSCQDPYTCQTEPIPPGEAASFSVIAAPLSEGQLQNQLMATTSLPDPSPADNTEVVTTDVAGPDCTIAGTVGDESLVGTSNDDVICALGGNDTVTGMEGDDILRGGSGADVLDGGTGDDLLDGGTQQDTASFASAPGGITADLGAGTASGHGTDTLVGVEQITGSPHHDVLTAGLAGATIDGGAGLDLLFAGGAQATLLGGPGDDYLKGGPGVAVLDGGEGTNTCVWDNDDQVTDCLSTDPGDGNDVRGGADLRGVSSSLGTSSLVFTFRNRHRVKPRRLWDKGYFTVALDTRGDSGADYIAVLRAVRRGFRGALITASGRTVRKLKVRKSSRYSLTLWVDLPSGPDRSYYRWWVVTMITKKRCSRVCFDRVPNQGAMIQPR